MSATVIDTGVTHEVSKLVDFYFYAHTACEARISWNETYAELESLDLESARDLATRTDREVDCMACIAKGASE